MSAMETGRRRFLWLSGGLAAWLSAGYGISKLNWGDPADVVVAVLTRQLGYLDVDRASFRLFASDYAVARRKHRRGLSVLSAVALPLRLFTPAPWLEPGNALSRLEDNVVSRYLLSTDFFQHGADEASSVNYVAFYDPYNAICRNPFVNESETLRERNARNSSGGSSRRGEPSS